LQLQNVATLARVVQGDENVAAESCVCRGVLLLRISVTDLRQVMNGTGQYEVVMLE
jgi:hypothetical protein